MRFRLRACLLTLALTGASAPALAAFSDIYVFGDSLSDNGTAADAAPPAGVDFGAPYSSVPAEDINRVSNGPLAVEILANRLGLSLNPSLFLTSIPAAGTNYAVGGARTNASGFPDGLIDLGSQVTAFASNHLSGAPADALYVVFIGGNDLRAVSNTSVDDATATAAINTAVGAVEDALNELIDLGAESILVPNLLDIGLIPEKADVAALATARTKQYNQLLATTLAEVESSRDVNLFEYDTFALMQDVLDNFDVYGFTNITDPCTDGDLLSPTFEGSCNASVIDQYAFIDDIHPTQKLHEIIGNEFAAVVPIPAALPLLASALLGLGFAARRRAG